MWTYKTSELVVVAPEIWARLKAIALYDVRSFDVVTSSMRAGI